MRALVTGASAGIGEACARALAAKGCDLVLGARRVERLEALAAELRPLGVQVTLASLDVTDRTSVDSFLERCGNPVVDVLVNNAGLARGFSALPDNDPSDWDEMIDANVKGLLWMSRAVLRPMIERVTSQPGTRGHIVNIGSIAGIAAYPNGTVYCATKAAVKLITDGTRMDVLQHPIRVTLVQPGMVETEFSQVRFRGDTVRAKAVYQGIEPLTAADIADTVVWTVFAPPHVQVSEVTVMATHQASPTMAHRRS